MKDCKLSSKTGSIGFVSIRILEILLFTYLSVLPNNLDNLYIYIYKYMHKISFYVFKNLELSKLFICLDRQCEGLK